MTVLYLSKQVGKRTYWYTLIGFIFQIFEINENVPVKEHCIDNVINLMLRMYALIQDIGKTDKKLNEMR